MTDKSVLWAYQQVYEPTKEMDSWVVNYKDDKVWKKERFETHELAYDFYWAKVQQAKVYYNNFLRGLDNQKE